MSAAPTSQTKRFAVVVMQGDGGLGENVLTMLSLHDTLIAAKIAVTEYKAKLAGAAAEYDAAGRPFDEEVEGLIARNNGVPQGLWLFIPSREREFWILEEGGAGFVEEELDFTEEEVVLAGEELNREAAE